MPVTTQQFVYPTSLELQAIDQDLLPVLQLSNPIFKDFPIKEIDAVNVAWEYRDNYLGLMQARGVEGEYPSVQPVAVNRKVMNPSRMGENMWITQEEIEERRGFGRVNEPINVKDLIIERQEQLATRQFNRMAWIAWTLVSGGNYIIVAANGAIEKKDAILNQTYTGTTWATLSTATPLFDFRAVKLLHRGHSVRLDANATAFMNTKTFNSMIANTNANDLGGRRSTGLETIEGLDQYNKFIALRDNLPQVVEYDEGYLDSTGTFQPFIPDNTVVIIGKRTNGAPIGDFALTRNADNPSVSSAPVVKVVDSGAGENEHLPRKIGIYRGFNGGPRVFYPTSIVVMTVS